MVAKASPQLSSRSGQIGTINQMGIVLGLFSAQAAGMVFTGAVSYAG
jgi:SP family facilitated glucose transporter-like MFS transporter 3